MFATGTTCSVAGCDWWQTHLQALHHFHSHSWSRNWPTASQEQSSSVSEPQSDHWSWTQQPSHPCQSLGTRKEHVSTLLSIVNSIVWLSSNCSVFDLTLTMVTASQSTQWIPIPAARGYICIPLCSSTVERVRTLRVMPTEPSVAPAMASTPPSAPASTSHSPVKKQAILFSISWCNLWENKEWEIENKQKIVHIYPNCAVSRTAPVSSRNSMTFFFFSMFWSVG